MTYPAAYRMTMTGARLKEVLEDVADNLFNPDPYYQQGGDMVRVGGLAYAIDIGKPMGGRISESDARCAPASRLEAAREYVVAGWASINESDRGPADLGRGRGVTSAKRRTVAPAKQTRRVQVTGA